MTRRYTYKEAAEKLRVEVRWLQRNIKRLPYSKKGRIVTFTDEDLDRIDAMHHHEPETNEPGQPAPLRPVGPHPLAELKPLPSRVQARQHA
jgi:hypothetical protein